MVELADVSSLWPRVRIHILTLGGSLGKRSEPVRVGHCGQSDAACRQLEIRAGSGWFERRRATGFCAQLKYVDRWTYSERDGHLVIDTGRGLCTYALGEGLGRLTTVDDATCREFLGSLA
jgi:hypothetical protein